MIRAVTFLLGLAFLAAGILGFMPDFVTDGLLFGIFEIDPMHNFIHAASGILAILAAFSFYYSRLYLQVFGLLYGVVTVAGFVFAGDLYLMHVNMADNALHLLITAIALFFGFIYRDRT